MWGSKWETNPDGSQPEPNKGTRTMKEMTDTSIERNFSLVWTSSEGTTRLTTESSLGLGPDD